MTGDKIIKLLLVTLSILSGYSFANPILTEDDLLADIHMVSSVTHMRQSLEKTPAAITIIDRRTIEASVAVDVFDLFRLVPGFRAFLVNANAPGLSYHSIGQDNSRRLEVKIDGRSVYESIFSSVEWTTLGVELDDIDYVEIVRGGNAPADGSNAFLASINIVTRSPLLDNGWSLRSQIGSASTRNTSLTYSGKLGDIDLRTKVSYRANDGFEDFAGNYNGRFREVALDDSAETITLGFKGLWTPSSQDSVELQFGISDSSVGIGEIDYIQRQLDYQYQHINWRHMKSSGDTIDFVLYHNKFDISNEQNPLTFYQALAFFPPGPTRDALSQLPDKLIIEPRSAAVSERWDTELRATFQPAEAIRGVYGAAIRYDEVSSNELFDMADSQSESSYRAFANFEWTMSDSLVFNSGFISEHREEGSGVNSYRIASNYKLGNQHNFRLAFNRGYRAPTLLETHQSTFFRYDENLILDGSIVSDPDVQAERLMSSELGYAGSFLDNTLNIDVRLFKEDISDMIAERREQYPDVDGQLNIRDNTDHADINGVEWQAQFRPSSQLLVHANYSFVDLKHTALYRTTPQIEIRDLSRTNPRHIAGLLVNYITEADVSLSAMLNYQSAIYHYSGAVTDDYTRVDLKASKKWYHNNSSMELSLNIQNLGSDHREFYFYNQFQTKYLLGLRVSFP
jgi:iron complex outermembrane receptor protein